MILSESRIDGRDNGSGVDLKPCQQSMLFTSQEDSLGKDSQRWLFAGCNALYKLISQAKVLALHGV